MDLLTSIENKRNSMAVSEQKVADYLLENYSHIESTTITRIAHSANVSTSAVLRFCKTMGYQGYKDFRFAMADYLHSQTKNTGGDVYADFFENYQQLLPKLADLPRDQIKRLIAALTNERPNFIFGVYRSAIPAQDLAYSLCDLNHLSIYSSSTVETSHYAGVINPEDTIVFFSITGSKYNFASLLAGFNDSIPKNSFLITLNPNADLSKCCSETIVLPGLINTQQSVIDLESIPTLFVESLINYMHEQ
ncbi:MurR/RpiR family transcriptional regulator [Lactobacillus porci]|uniref:MurR/RpiR family transcriptional regulator n=1 Tax=Lactobacillus porci TaxID=2012477 RepID=UPI003992970A